MRYAAIALHLDSLAEAYGFPAGYQDPCFGAVADRFFDIAGKYNFKYSIYVLGKDLEDAGNRRHVREWASQGHEIGNHSWSHPTNLGAMAGRQMREEIEKAHKIISCSIGHEPKGFVSPAWSTSRQLFDILIGLKYEYDISLFPSWLMYPALAKLVVNHFKDERMSGFVRRKDFLYFLAGQRGVHNITAGENSIMALPMPSNRLRMASWHTLVFMFGRKIHEMILRSCLHDVDAFYYVVHPADLIDEKDLARGRKIHLERLKTPLKQKIENLESAIKIIKDSGREIVTLRELAARHA